MREITVREAAQAYGFTRQHLHNLIAEGKLPARKVRAQGPGPARWLISEEAVRRRAALRKKLGDHARKP